jgi:hypothetical protein
VEGLARHRVTTPREGLVLSLFMLLVVVVVLSLLFFLLFFSSPPPSPLAVSSA